MRNGAYDYIAKRFDIDELDITVSKSPAVRDIVRDARACAPGFRRTPAHRRPGR